MIRRGDSAGVRYECKAKNCWKPERLDYRGREDAIQRIMKNWKKLAIYYSQTKKGCMSCNPHIEKDGNKNHCWSGQDSPRKIPLRLFYHLVEALKDHIESDERTKNSREEKSIDTLHIQFSPLHKNCM